METFAANCSLNATTANCSHQLNNVRTLPSQSSAVKLVKMSAYVAISLVALLGNVFVVMIICRNKSLRKTVNLFILNMAISDLFAPVIAVPMHLYSLHVNAITATFAWPFEGLIGNISCKVAMFLVDSSPVISILSLVLMSGDRFYAVVFPLKAPRVRYKIRVALLVCSWIVAFSYFSPYFEIVSLQYIFGQPSCVLYWPPPYDHAKSMQIYSTIMCVFFTIIPFVLLSVMYSVMLWILRKKKIARHHIRSASSRRQRNNRNIVFMALAIVVVFAICWGPYNGFVFIATFVWKWKYPEQLYLQIDIDAFFFTMAFLTCCNAALNPIVYFIFIQNYRSALKRLLCGVRAPNFSPKNTLTETAQNWRLKSRRQLLASTDKPEAGSNEKASSV